MKRPPREGRPEQCPTTIPLRPAYDVEVDARVYVSVQPSTGVRYLRVVLGDYVHVVQSDGGWILDLASATPTPAMRLPAGTTLDEALEYGARLLP